MSREIRRMVLSGGTVCSPLYYQGGSRIVTAFITNNMIYPPYVVKRDVGLMKKKKENKEM